MIIYYKNNKCQFISINKNKYYNIQSAIDF